MGFYNPYMQHPDYAGGVSDFIQQMFQMMMYKRFMDSMDKGEQGGMPTANQYTGAGGYGKFQPPMPQQVPTIEYANDPWKTYMAQLLQQSMNSYRKPGLPTFPNWQ